MGRLTLRTIPAPEVAFRLDELAALRITVFRDFPYLYDGDLDYERIYLKAYTESENAFVGGAFDGDRLVGACTAAPLLDHREEFAKPFAEARLEIGDYFYFGESVLLKEYRGEGAGVAFFRLREEEALRQGYSKCVFCAVRRPADHPMRPANYRPLDAFWQKRGYARIPGLEAGFSWKDIGDDAETVKPMDFWGCDLAGQ